jgi:hypothetical protein
MNESDPDDVVLKWMLWLEFHEMKDKADNAYR